MDIVYVLNRTMNFTLGVPKWKYLIQIGRRLEPRVLPWQHHRLYHEMYFVSFNYGAKFQLHCPIICRDIIDFVF